jgi:hypothetical protein
MQPIPPRRGWLHRDITLGALSLLGQLLLLYAFVDGVTASMSDISVPGDDGGRIINQGLANDRLTRLLAANLTAIVGFSLVAYAQIKCLIRQRQP